MTLIFSGRMSDVIFFKDLKLLFPISVSAVQVLKSRVVRASLTLLNAFKPIEESAEQPVKSIDSIIKSFGAAVERESFQIVYTSKSSVSNYGEFRTSAEIKSRDITTVRKCFCFNLL